MTLGKKTKKKDSTAEEYLRPLASVLDHGADNMFTLGRVAANKAANELRLRCTEFDETGKVTLVNGEFKKSELIAKVGLREMRASMQRMIG